MYYTLRDGYRMFYEEKGVGPVIIMVHGWACNHKFFSSQIEEFSKSHRVIAIDMRGHGESDTDVPGSSMSIPNIAADIKDLMDGLGIEKAILMCWSIGVLIGYSFVQQFGCDRLEKLIMIDMSPKTSNEEDWDYGMGRSETYKDVLNWANFYAFNWETASQAFVPGTFGDGSPKDDQAELLDWCRKEIGRTKSDNLVFLTISMSTSDFRDVLPTITVPTLLVHGLNSVMFGSHGEKVRSMIPGAKLEMIPGGHIMFMEHPKEFNKAVLNFLNS